MNVVKTGGGLYIELQGTAEALPFGREALNRLLDLADAGMRAADRAAARPRRAVSRKAEGLSRPSERTRSRRCGCW